jgi:UDP-N-acetylglucosamine 2-epimerase
MLMDIEEVLMMHKPDMVLVYGDTNSTIAGALAAVKLHIEVAHVEAGLRSFNRTMPEEHNRVLTDHCSTYLLCPTEKAVQQLEREGIIKNVHLVGDTMYDAVVKFTAKAQLQSNIMAKLSLEPKSFCLATVHRPYNTDEPENLNSILRAFSELSYPVIFPVHPRTRKKITELSGITVSDNVRMIEPIGYMDMLVLQKNAYRVLTDSGGIQKEAFSLETPCITLRTETEWVETTESGWNILVGAAYDKIVDSVDKWQPPTSKPPSLFGDGNAADKIIRTITQ